jgi:ferredoxin
LKHNVLVKNKNINKQSNDSKNLMDGLAIHSNLVPKGCHNGACGVCKILVHCGNYEKLKMNRKHISEEEENSNIVLACRAIPKSDMEIEFLGKPKSKLYTFGN